MCKTHNMKIRPLRKFTRRVRDPRDERRLGNFRVHKRQVHHYYHINGARFALSRYTSFILDMLSERRARLLLLPSRLPRGIFIVKLHTELTWKQLR